MAVCYEFYCKSCEATSEIMRPMSEAGEPAFCEECGTEMVRLYGARVHADSYRRPIVSDSLAVSMSQIEEHKRTFPDIKMLDDGRPVFEDYASHDSYLKKTGFIKSPGKKKRGKKLKAASKMTLTLI